MVLIKNMMYNHNLIPMIESMISMMTETNKFKF